MKNGRHRRLSRAGKIIVFGGIAILIVIVALIVFAVTRKPQQGNKQDASAPTSQSASASSDDKNQNDNDVSANGGSSNANASTDESDSETSGAPIEVNGECNTYGGYTAVFVANGGNTTKAGSYFDQAGLNVTVNIEDNDDVIIQDFIDGKIDFFYMTVNKMSLVCKQLEDAGVDVVIPYLSDTSTGGDGIIANNQYQSIADLAGTKIAMARNSVSTAVPVWLLNQSGLDSVTIQGIINNFALYDSTQDAVQAFINGEAGAVSTWDITTALTAENSHVLFSTEDGQYLVIDALIVNKNFADAHPEAVQAIVDGTISAVNDMNSGTNIAEAYQTIRDSVPDFAEYDDETMKDVLADTQYLGYKQNVEAFDIAKQIYTDFCTVWQQLGFETDPDYVNQLFDDSYLNALSTKWANETVNEQEEVVVSGEVTNREALISRRVQLLFEPNSAEFLHGYEEEDKAMLDEYVTIAKILNRMVIQIEGNISLDPGTVSNAADYELSRMRAQCAKDYLVANGIEESRIFVVANGGDKPIASNETAEGRQQNRNCIISIYQGEG